MLVIRLELPSGRYVAARGDDPGAPEWPPHPSRVFSALVAASYRGTGMSEARRRALEWLEQLQPPALWAPVADLTPAPVTYVPPGDISGSKGAGKDKRHEHPVHRWRQERRFPEARILGTPTVEMSWTVEPPEVFLRELQAIASEVTHVGTSHSMAIVSVTHGAPLFAPNYVPDRTGELSLRTTLPGRLAELDETFAQQGGVRRPLPRCEIHERYRHDAREGTGGPAGIRDLLVLRIDGPRYGLEDTYVFMRSIRAALMSVLDDKAPACLHGHGESEHVAWLPLADVGHPHASGQLLGVGLSFHTKLAQEERDALLSGMARLASLKLPDGRDARLVVPVPGTPIPRALRANTWGDASHEWATVTPVVLDRAPKRPDPQKLTEALARSLTMAGYPEPDAIEISPHGIFRGTPDALAFEARQPRFHARVRFPEMVAGPVIAGRQRFFGVGFFRPVSSNGST